MLSAIRDYIRNAKWQRLIAPFKRAEAEALKRGDMQALHRARAKTRQFTTTALGWRRGVR